MKMKMKMIESPKVFLLLQICLSNFRSEKTNSSLKIAFFLSQIEFSLVFMKLIKAIIIELNLSIFPCIDFARLLICVIKSLSYFKTEEKLLLQLVTGPISTLPGR